MDLATSCHHINQALPSLLPLSILLASFLGSLHCVGMCGGLIIASTRSAVGIMAYHVGRLMGYIVLGLGAGYLGKQLYHIPIIPILIGLSFITMGIMLLRKKRPFHFSGGTKILGKIMAIRSVVTPSTYAGLIGFGSIFLPCGWLYTYVLAISQTQNPVNGAILMTVFWLGTLPALISSPLLLNRILKPVATPIASAIFMLAGLLTLIYRF